MRSPWSPSATPSSTAATSNDWGTSQFDGVSVRRSGPTATWPAAADGVMTTAAAGLESRTTVTEPAGPPSSSTTDEGATDTPAVSSSTIDTSTLSTATRAYSGSVVVMACSIVTVCSSASSRWSSTATTVNDCALFQLALVNTSFSGRTDTWATSVALVIITGAAGLVSSTTV